MRELMKEVLGGLCMVLGAGVATAAELPEGYGEALCEMDPVGVCSWSWHEPMTNIIRRMEANGFKGIQLALSPWVWEGEGSAAQRETFGDQEGEGRGLPALPSPLFPPRSSLPVCVISYFENWK